MSYNTPLPPISRYVLLPAVHPLTPISPLRPLQPRPSIYLTYSSPLSPYIFLSTLLSPPRALRECEYCTYLALTSPFCAFRTFLIWPLVCSFVSFLVRLLFHQNNTPRLRLIVSSPCVPCTFSPPKAFFFLVSLTEPRLSRVVHRTHFPLETSPPSWKRQYFRPGCLCLPRLTHPAFPIFCGGLVRGRLGDVLRLGTRPAHPRLQ